MAATWNRITRSPTALRADSIRTELAFHLVKSWSGRLRNQKEGKSENEFNRHNSKPNPYVGIQLYTGRLLQFTFVNVLLVHGVISGVGFTQSCGSCVASASRYVGRHHSVRRRNRLFCQLGQESHLSLQHQCLDISGGCSGLSADRYWLDSNRATLRLAIRGCRNCALVHSRVAIRNSNTLVKVYEGLGKRGTRGGDHSRSFHARLLPPARIPWRGRAREPQPLGAAIQSLAVARRDCIPMRWFSAAVFQEILHKKKQGHSRALLGCCGDRDPGGPVSSTGRHPHRRIEVSDMVKNKWLWALLGLVVLAVAWSFLWSPITPKGQPPLTRLTNDNLFVNQFNHTASNVRMVLLLSPT